MKKNRMYVFRSGGCVLKLLKIMRLGIYLLLLTTLTISAKGFSQKLKVTLNIQQQSMLDIIKELRKASGYQFLFQVDELKKHDKRDFKVKDADVEEVMKHLLDGTNLTWRIEDDIILIKTTPVQTSLHEKKIIRGIVRDNNGLRLAGVTVLVKDSKVGVSTDSEGRFELPYSGEEQPVIHFSFIGMMPREVTYKGQSPLEVWMEPDITDLEEVIITGYQKIDPRRSTSAISSVKAADILVAGMTSIDQALEGRIPELMLINNSGEVGATPRIRVRGTSSLLGNREPLWVLDGFIMRDPVNVSNEDLNNPDYINIIGNAIAGINPQDIERIDILKDASATALYGTRAANGVIVVTTKKGTIGQPRFSYNHSSKLTRRPRYSDRNINLMNSQERVKFGKDLSDLHYKFPVGMPTVGYEGALYRHYTGATDYNQFMAEITRYETENTDWFKLLTKDAYSHDHTLGLSGGDEKIRYYISLGYNQENGVSKTTDVKRYTARVNLDINMTEKFKMNVSLNGNIQKKNHLLVGDVMDYAYNTTRALPGYKEDGTLFYYNKTSNSRPEEKFRYNLINEINNSSNTYNGNTFGAMLNLQYKIFRGMELTLAGNYSQSNTMQEKWWGEKSWHVACLKNGEYEEIPKMNEEGYSYIPYGGIQTTIQSTSENYTFRAQADYRKHLGEDEQHLVNVMGGFEMNGDVMKTMQDEYRGFLKDRGLQFIDNIDLEKYPHYKNWLNKNHRQLTHGISHQISGYMTISYGYKNHFTLNANGRFDGSNKFGSRSNEKFLPIWSVSGMWNLKENILKNQDICSDFRLRASYGVQGNMLEDQSPNLIIKKGSINPFYNENVSEIARYPNPNLRWEQTRQVNGEVEIAFLNSRLSLNGSIYYKNTEDCFTEVKISSVNGVKGNTYVMNGGRLTNSGYSVGIRSTPVRLKNFQWNVSTYLDGNINKVRSNTVEAYTLSDYLNGTALIDGKSIGSFYSYRFLGLNPRNGVPVFDDYHDRRHLLEYKSLEETVLMAMERSGQRDPLFNGSFANSLTYKGFSLSVNMVFSLGSKVRLFPLYKPVINGISAETNMRKEFLNRWMVPGDEQHTQVPVIMSPSDTEYYKYISHYSTAITNITHIKTFASNIWTMYDQSDLRVVSGSYLKCSSLSLRYQFAPQLLRKTPFSNIGVSLNALNLFTVSAKELRGQDPSQTGFDKPNLSIRPSYTLQFNMTF